MSFSSLSVFVGPPCTEAALACCREKERPRPAALPTAYDISRRAFRNLEKRSSHGTKLPKRGIFGETPVRLRQGRMLGKAHSVGTERDRRAHGHQQHSGDGRTRNEMTDLAQKRVVAFLGSHRSQHCTYCSSMQECKYCAGTLSILVHDDEAALCGRISLQSRQAIHLMDSLVPPSRQ